MGTGLRFALEYSTLSALASPTPRWKHGYEMRLDIGSTLVTLETAGGEEVDFILDSGNWVLDTRRLLI